MSVRHHGGPSRPRERAGPSQRQLRVGEELRHTLVEILREGGAHDPQLQNLNVTVTEVRISPDLKHATAFIMPLGGAHASETVAALNRASAFFRKRMAAAVTLRYTPSISFALDTSFAYAERIDGLLHNPAVRRDIEAATDSDSDSET